jgi:hypothetical protein
MAGPGVNVIPFLPILLRGIGSETLIWDMMDLDCWGGLCPLEAGSLLACRTPEMHSGRLFLHWGERKEGVLYNKLQQFLNLKKGSMAGGIYYSVEYENNFYRIFWCIFVK